MSQSTQVRICFAGGIVLEVTLGSRSFADELNVPLGNAKLLATGINEVRTFILKHQARLDAGTLAAVFALMQQAESEHNRFFSDAGENDSEADRFDRFQNRIWVKRLD